MKQHLHKHLIFSEGDYLSIHFNCNALIFYVDDLNYQAYINDQYYEMYGKEVTVSPFNIAPPTPGVWHLVIEQIKTEETLDVQIELLNEIE